MPIVDHSRDEASQNAATPYWRHMKQFLTFGQSIIAGVALGMVFGGVANVIDVSTAINWLNIGDIKDFISNFAIGGAILGLFTGIFLIRNK